LVLNPSSLLMCLKRSCCAKFPAAKKQSMTADIDLLNLKTSFKYNYFLHKVWGIFTNKMCGIAGILYFDSRVERKFNQPSKILRLLQHRGPDHQAFTELGNCSLFHTRLSIVDVSPASNQPFMDADKTSGMAFNGEIFNYKSFNSAATGDVPVLFDLLKKENRNCLPKLNGFFALAFFEREKNALLLARDRFGVKPLYYYQDPEKIAFASELKPLLELCGSQELNARQMHAYFRLNYCSGKETIFKNIYRLLPGECIEVKNGKAEISSWYSPAVKENKESLADLLDDSVKLRLNADVPVGTFLSGGIDSSIISAIAKKHHPGLHTFSIGFSDETFFDETAYAELVARHIGSNHHVFKLSESDFTDNIESFLHCIDEPFADSSAFNFYILSKFTRAHVKVALSGDGADELFRGYNKHRAAFMKNDPALRLAATLASPLLSVAGASRSSKLGNASRQAKKFKAIQHLSEQETFKYLASISGKEEVDQLLLKSNAAYFDSLFETENKNFPAADLLDLKVVLADDMLVKADRFSMRHGLEIRNPFLDYRIVEYALNLEEERKINRKSQKVILRETFAHLLPREIFERRKKGFELPLQKWLTGKLADKVKNDWLNPEKIKAEGLLDHAYVQKVRSSLISANPGDSAARLWAIIVFESWYNNFKAYIKS
jgi:asparagine synthase (glutamine-hydrolysing)